MHKLAFESHSSSTAPFRIPARDFWPSGRPPNDDVGLHYRQSHGESLHREALERRIDEDVALQELDARTDNLWALLLFSGYLSPVNLERSDGSGLVRFKIPNQEVRSNFAETFLYWLSTGADPDGEDNLDTLSAAALANDQSTAQGLLQRRGVGWQEGVSSIGVTWLADLSRWRARGRGGAAKTQENSGDGVHMRVRRRVWRL